MKSSAKSFMLGFSEGWTLGVHGREVFHAWIQVKEPRTVQFFLFEGVSETLARWLGLNRIASIWIVAGLLITKSSLVSPIIPSFSVTQCFRSSGFTIRVFVL